MKKLWKKLPNCESIRTLTYPAVFLPFGVSQRSFQAMKWEYLLHQLNDIKTLISWAEQGLHEEHTYPWLMQPEELYLCHDLCLWTIHNDKDGMDECDPDKVKFSKYDTRTHKLVEYCCLVHPSRIVGDNYAGADDDWQSMAIAYGHDRVEPKVRRVKEEFGWREHYGFGSKLEWWEDHGHMRLGIALGIYKSPSPFYAIGHVSRDIDPKHYNKQIEYTVLEYPVTYAEYIEWQALRFCSPV